MKKNYFSKIIITLLVIVGLIALLKKGGSYFFFSEENEVSVKTQKNSILHMELSGVILNGKKFIKNLKKYKKDPHIKAFVINVNSPGGAVGPSQEVYAEIKRAREETKKPFICVSTGIMASGAYYSSLACDKIMVAPGSLIGSIGVIMEFANLSKLYDWAKIERFTITSGKFKDSGNEFRPMKPEERELFQSMITEVYGQFRGAVKEARKLKDEVLDQYADGRVFTGTKAVKLGFADAEGMFEDAVKMAARDANLGDDYDLIEIPKKKRSIFDFGEANEDDPINSLSDLLHGQSLVGSKNGSQFVGSEIFKSTVETLLKTKYVNQPMFLMPGFWTESE